MLNAAAVMAFVPTTDMEVAREFYGTTLGLTVVDESEFALVVEAGGTTIRIVPVPGLRPQQFTIVGWVVDDIEAAVAELVARGVPFNRYEGMEQSPTGIWTSPSGARIAWFTDPDQNVLSLTQFA